MRKPVDKAAVARRIKLLLDLRGTDQSKFARAKGLTQQTMNNYATGVTAEGKYIRDIADGLRTTVKWLLWEEGPRDNFREVDPQEILNLIARIPPWRRAELVDILERFVA